MDMKNKRKKGQIPMSIELEVLSDALTRVRNSLDSSLRALVDRCQMMIKRIPPPDEQNNAIERRIYF